MSITTGHFLTTIYLKNGAYGQVKTMTMPELSNGMLVFKHPDVADVGLKVAGVLELAYSTSLIERYHIVRHNGKEGS